MAENVVPLAPAQDYKRIFDGDEGPNTGGMGSYSPVPDFDPERTEELADLVHRPIVERMAERGTPFHGVLYAGLMMTSAGPKVLEFNTRFGDPETQAVLPRLRSDLAELCLASREPGGLEGVQAEFSSDWAVTLVLASAGYPASSSKGDVITGIDQAAALRGVEVTHAGTAHDADRNVVTAGGRVINVTALGPGPVEARDRAYDGRGDDRVRWQANANGHRPEGGRARTRLNWPERGATMESSDPRGGGEIETGVAEPVPDGKPAEAMPDVETAFSEIEVDAPRVGIIMGSKNDKPKMQAAGQALEDAGIRYEVRVMSAHRDPEMVREYCHSAKMRGLKVIIAGAGMSAALPGVAAAHTDLPVIGVPILGKSLGGLDALLSAVQMPPGIPVACVAIDGSKNAGVLAARIINC